MMNRCSYPSAPNWAAYGGAGVTVSPEWRGFEDFLASLGERPKGTTIGRVLDMGNYELGNAFWQTDEEQRLARRNKSSILAWLDGMAGA